MSISKIKILGSGGFGVPVANILFATGTPDYAFSGTSCTGLFGHKAYALA
jgi:hypothetical protein